jgi:transcriptional regulator with XRE-family HTH domain
LQIRSRRDALRVSQKTLGDKLGVTTQQVHDYEHGLTRMSVGRLVEIARALGRPVIDLVGEHGKAEAPTGGPIAVHFGLAEAPQLLRAYGAMPRALGRTTLKLLVAIVEDQADQRQDDGVGAAPGKLGKDRHAKTR